MKNGTTDRIIFHIDMNAFFCTVAEIKDPKLRGKAFAIGRKESLKGVISTASYEARKYGIHSGMPTIEALKLLPSLLIIHIDYSHYLYYHEKFINLVKEYTNLIEVASIDEVFCDMTEISNYRHPLDVAKEIQDRLVKEYKLPSSIGIAPTLFLAKMASDIKKPRGITVIRRREIEKILYPLSVKDIFGIGKKTYPRLLDNNINTIKDFMDINNKDKIIKLIGENTYNYATSHILGHSSDIVDPNRYSESKSISECQTYDVPISVFEDLILESRKLARSVYNRLIKEKYYFKTVKITLRDKAFNTITRQVTFDDYIQDYYVFNDALYDLFEANFKDLEYRLIGVGLANLIKEDKIEKEYNLFTYQDIDTKKKNINKLIKEFQEKFGENALYIKKDKK